MLPLCDVHAQVILTCCSVVKGTQTQRWSSCDQEGNEVGEKLPMNELTVRMGVEKGRKLTLL